MARFCFSCGGDADERDHWRRCDGRQGRVEETYDAWARATDPDTSHVAAAVVDAAGLELRTMIVLLRGERTTEEIGHCLHVPRDSISPRMRSLERKGFVERIGKRCNASGIRALTWELTNSGRERLASKKKP